jgi:hypothetical protein
MRGRKWQRREGIGQVPSGLAGREVRPYRKYRPLPALIMIVVLAGVSAVIWFQALSGGTDVDEAIRCNPPASPPPGVSYTPVSHDALDDVAPIPPDRVEVRVLNASGKRGQAALVSESLRQLGFTNTNKPGNDKAFQNREAPACRGQIRFGANGEAAARTLSLVDSCVELIRDGRTDASVDLAIGGDMNDVTPRQEAITALEILAKWSASNPSSSELSAKKAPQIGELLGAARGTNC